MNEPWLHHTGDINDARTASRRQTRSSRGVSYTIITLILIGGAGLWVFPGPQIRAKRAQEARIAANQQAHQRMISEAKQAKAAKDRRVKEEQEIANATDAELKGLVDACEGLIRTSHAGPFDLYFTRYPAYKLEPFKTYKAAYNGELGRPSVVLDDYSFDPRSYNIQKLKDPDSRSYWSITFVVEGAEDGLSIKNFAAVYNCQVNGLAPSSAREIDRIYF